MSGTGNGSLVSWNAIKAAWESGTTSYQLAKDYPITRQAIDKRAKAEGWSRDAGNQQPGGWLGVACQTNIIDEPRVGATPEKLAGILESISAGATQEIAARAHGISPDTLRRWIERDKALEHAIDAARGQRAIKRMKSVEAAHERGDWKAAAYLLERDDMTKTQFGGHQGAGGITIVLNIPREPESIAIEGSVVSPAPLSNG